MVGPHGRFAPCGALALQGEVVPAAPSFARRNPASTPEGEQLAKDYLGRPGATPVARRCVCKGSCSAWFKESDQAAAVFI